MDHGAVWGHGSQRGPEFSATSLRIVALAIAETFSMEDYGKSYKELDALQRGIAASVLFNYNLSPLEVTRDQGRRVGLGTFGNRAVGRRFLKIRRDCGGTEQRAVIFRTAPSLVYVGNNYIPGERIICHGDDQDCHAGMAKNVENRWQHSVFRSSIHCRYSLFCRTG